ncbi:MULTISPECIES: NAD(P)/FAD-dependent oxidoreductase [unclassified Mesorhizobium]|uniref:FAD-dependent oxidoreductase n=1 Tax=unclassified Mesorhizobium TaxID=325217 RepID=UPI0003CF41BB|nr:NAD(P)/FAD-dependent oxidoreductase [Mesorhizobium sp. LSJC280B00]ESW85181.1 monooxygenase [Mesorhizobium sp. LSJC280B00]
MTASRDASILIVGAGPTGLTAAVELARRGIAPRIIDRKEGPTPLAKAVGISSHSLDILEPSKVAARLLAEGLKIRRARFYFEGRALGEIDFSILPHRHNFLLSLPQRDTESLMTDTLKGFGIDVEWRSTFVGMAEHKGRAEVRIEAPDGRDEASFDLIFGADGAQSTVRDAMSIGFDGYTHRRQWSIADADIDDWPYEPMAAHAFLHRNGDVGFIIPIGEKRYRAVSNTEDALARIPGNYRITRLLGTDRFHIPVRQAPRYQTACVFLGGDAAHVNSPLGARGMNLGIEDAASFARRFVDGTLAGYTSERHPVGQRWITLSERILSLAQSDNGIMQGVRNAAFSVVGHLPLLQRPLLERVAGLKE